MTERLKVNQDISRSTLVTAFGPSLEFDRRMAEFSTYHTGGPARYFLSARSAQEISEAVKTARKLELVYFILGGGSNILVSDEGYDGLIIKVDVKGLRAQNETSIEAGAGEVLMDLIEYSAQTGLTGLEFASGIAGSVGGALYGNAGAYGNEIGSVVAQVELVSRDGLIKQVGPEYCQFAYRDSYLKRSGDAVAGAIFKLGRGDKAAIRGKIDEIIRIRNSKLPVSEYSAGCFFKNIPDSREKFGKLPAGRLLEEAGAKSMSVGGAKVFEKHANIIVNTGTATSKDISELAAILRRMVFDKFGVQLEEEVIRIGNR